MEAGVGKPRTHGGVMQTKKMQNVLITRRNERFIDCALIYWCFNFLVEGYGGMVDKCVLKQ